MNISEFFQINHSPNTEGVATSMSFRALYVLLRMYDSGHKNPTHGYRPHLVSFQRYCVFNLLISKGQTTVLISNFAGIFTNSIHPLFGPASGGTNITITGISSCSADVPDVKVGDNLCALLTWYV